MTNDDVIFYVISQGYTVSQLICGLCVLDEQHKIVARVKDEETETQEEQFQILLDKFKDHLAHNGTKPTTQ